jgi:hypothetical protein
MVDMGSGAGSGNFAICEVVKYHISEDIMTGAHIDQRKLDLVGRNGGNFYTRANGDALFELAKPGQHLGMGYDQLPSYMKQSDIYSANDLGKFALATEYPSLEMAEKTLSQIEIFEAGAEMFDRHERMQDYKMMLRIALSLEKQGAGRKSYFERAAKMALVFDDLEFAWAIAIYSGNKFK